MQNEIKNIMPDNILKEIESIGANDNITEIRLRVGKKGIIIVSNVEFFLSCIVTLKNLLDILVKVSKNSIYAIQNDINNGFVVVSRRT